MCKPLSFYKLSSPPGTGVSILSSPLPFADIVQLKNYNNMAPPKETKFKVAAAHAAPVFMNKAATIKKTVQLIQQAAKDDIKLLVFPETFIPGYPVRTP